MTKANQIITGPFGAWLNTILLALVVFFSIKLYDRVEDSFKRIDALEIKMAFNEGRFFQQQKQP